MQLAAATSQPPAGAAFAEASTRYTKALGALEFPANARIDIRSAASTAIDHASNAIALLEPFATSGDMFTSRNAASSIASAKTGVTALQNALATLDAKVPGAPLIPIDTFLTVARNTFTQAESALWWE